MKFFFSKESDMFAVFLFLLLGRLGLCESSLTPSFSGQVVMREYDNADASGRELSREENTEVPQPTIPSSPPFKFPTKKSKKDSKSKSGKKGKKRAYFSSP
eukprot:937900_1